MPVNTAQVTDRRKLHFNSIDEQLADIDRIVAADKAGTLRRTGNWTAGQVFNHLASWINYAYEGYPFPPPPWFIRPLIKMKMKSYMKEGMPGGVEIPGAPGGTYGTTDLPTDQAADLLRKAIARLKRGEPPKFDSPALGPMSFEDRVTLNLRHAELHMSYLHP